jgi:Zn-dependent protease/Tfp pilus assembly protein PilF
MESITSGAFRLFRVAGITVFIHWSWFLIAYLQIDQRFNHHDAVAWNIAEYVAIFGIVLLHEFGHALACRMVGGKADTIVLWPLGGIAYVDPPPRPGAVLWSIAAGPLVNLLLVPIFGIVLLLASSAGLGNTSPDAWGCLKFIAIINVWLLIFNMLPIYPLDGGQILQSLLWFVVGRWRALMIASSIGLVCGVIVVVLALFAQQFWITVLAGFVAWRSWAGFTAARHLIRVQPAIDLMNECGQLLQNREYDKVIDSCNRSLELLRDVPAAAAAVLDCRALAYRALGHLQRAIADISAAIQINPTPQRFAARGDAEMQLGDYRQAKADFEQAVRLEPRFAQVWHDLAWLLATCPQDDIRNGLHAIEAAKKACELTNWAQPDCLAVLAAAAAEAGQFTEAMEWQKKALASDQYRKNNESEGLRRLQLYMEGKPYCKETAPDISASPT